MGAGLVVAMSAAGVAGVRALDTATERTAHAAMAPGPTAVRPPDRAELAPVPGELTVFHGVSDDLLLQPLREGAISEVEVNSGGSSISLRIDFDNGARAAFKPQQVSWHSMPRKEIAAYRINRLLGMSSVAPAIGRAFSFDELIERLDPEHAFHLPRLQEEILRDAEGRVVGELSWWIPIIDHAKVDGFRVDSMEGIVTWKRYLTADAPVPHAQWPMVAQISDMVLYDFLINNPDRWSGGNVRCSEDRTTLYFMDNTMGFAPQPQGNSKSRIYLERVQKFSRALVRALRVLDESRIRDALAVDADAGPFDPLLQPDELEALLARRDYALRYIDGLIAVYGEDSVLVFP